MSNRRTIIFFALALVVAGCSSNDASSSPTDGVEYWSTSATLDGAQFDLVEGTVISVEFNDGSVRAHAGCNSIGGAAQIDDDVLRVTDLSMTEIGCDPQRHAQDDFVTALLSGRPTVSLDGDTMRLETASASVDFIDAAIANPARPLQGTVWEINGFLSGDTASSFAIDTPGTIQIDTDTMELFDGCATTALPVEVTDNEIRFEPIGPPEAPDCDAPAGYRQSIYTALSRGSLAYSIDGANMSLATPDNVGFTLIALS